MKVTHLESWPPMPSQENHWKAIIYSYCKSPLLTKEELMKVGFSEGRLAYESQHYMNIVYVELKD